MSVLKIKAEDTVHNTEEMKCSAIVGPAVKDCANLWPRIIPNPNNTA